MSDQNRENSPNFSIPGLLATKYLNDYKSSAKELSENLKFELIDHLIGCLDLVETYLLNENEENWKLYQDKERDFYKRHGERLITYQHNKMHLYYGDTTLLIEKGIYSPEQWESIKPEKQILSNSDLVLFLRLSRTLLISERNFLALLQAAEDEKKQGTSGKEVDYIIPRRSKIRREPKDKMTSLNQEQTVLLAYYLQQEKVFLKDEYLTDLEAARAFEILTGYSHNALRQNLGKYSLWITPPNLIELDELFTRLKNRISNEMKRK